MNLYVVDLFESVLSNEGRPSFPDGGAEEKILEIKKILNDKMSFVIFTAMGEKWSTENINRFLNHIEINEDHPRALFVLDSLSTKTLDETVNFNNWIVYSSQLMKVVCWEEQYGANADINLDTKKFLFLMGKPYKRWRINTLFHLYKKSLLDHAVYSFRFFDPDDIKKTKLIIDEVTDEEFYKFINDTQKDLDYPTVNWGMTGLPVDTNLYKNTSVSLVSETTCDSIEPWFLSEKTWRTIANRHCFVPLYTEATYNYVHSLGLKTFQDILPYKKEDFNLVNNNFLNYDQVDEIIEKSIVNIEFLINCLPDYKKYAIDTIEENYNTYKMLAGEHRKKIPQFLEEFFYLFVETPLTYKSIRKIDDDLSQIAIKKIWG